MDNNYVTICSPIAEYKIKRFDSTKIITWGIKRSACYSVIENDQLIYSAFKNSKKIVKVNKDGMITAIGKRGDIGYITIALKDDPKCHCVIFVKIK